MKQFQIKDNNLILRSKRAPLLITLILFIVAILFFIMPLFGMILYIANGDGFHVGFLFALFFFGILGFYMLRLALWNTYGNEVITFTDNYIHYVADYEWFKDGKKEREIVPSRINFSIRQIGYVDDNKGALVINLNDDDILCVTKMPTDQLEELVLKLFSLKERFISSNEK